MFTKTLITLNNLSTRLRRIRVQPENILLLLPHCLQWSECGQNLKEDINNCRRCGQCPIAEILKLQDRYNFQCLVASGGRQAIAAAKKKEIRVVIAVACSKELSAGILATVPKPVIAICNSQPCGFCHNTQVEINEVEDAIQSILQKTSPENK